MSEIPYKPEPIDFDKVLFKYFAVYGVEKLANILARYQLQNEEYTSENEYKLKRNRLAHDINCLIENLRIGEVLTTYQSEEIKEEAVLDDYGYYDTIKRTINVNCVSLAEFAAWAVINGFRCPKVILDKCTNNAGCDEVLKNHGAIVNAPIVVGCASNNSTLQEVPAPELTLETTQQEAAVTQSKYCFIKNNNGSWDLNFDDVVL